MGSTIEVDLDVPFGLTQSHKRPFTRHQVIDCKHFDLDHMCIVHAIGSSSYVSDTWGKSRFPTHQMPNLITMKALENFLHYMAPLGRCGMIWAAYQHRNG